MHQEKQSTSLRRSFLHCLADQPTLLVQTRLPLLERWIIPQLTLKEETSGLV